MTAKGKKSHVDSPKPRDSTQHDDPSNKKKNEKKQSKKNELQNGKGNPIPNSNANKNEKKEKNKNVKRSNSYNAKTSQGSRWSTLAYVNIFLLLILLIVSGSFIILCSNGDFSVEGVKSSWPCMKQHIYKVKNISGDVFTKENMVEAGRIVWLATLKGIEQLIVVSKFIIANTYDFLQRLVVILDPYAEPLKPYIWQVNDYLHFSFDWITNPENWTTIYEFLLWIANCLYEQLIVLKEELKRNNIALNYDSDTFKTWSTAFWNTTNSIRGTVLTFYNNASSQWLPYYAHQASNLMNSLRLSVESLFK